MAPMIPAERNCVSCGEIEGKYKCPKCSKYTCSLPCNKSHRAEHDNDPAPAPPAATTSAAAGEEEEAAAADEGLSPELRMLFRKYPNLRAQLSQIAGATDAPAAGAGGGAPPAHHHHPSQRGGRGGSGRGGRAAAAAKEPWTKDVGYQHGVAALRRALNGPEREGLAEYCELVRYQNARKAEAEAEDPDAAFRRLRAQRDAQVIGQLIKSEKERG